ncbi:MAG TPA: type 4a pilus biogenesis protein PilO [Trueperaceae bacterium]|nr:type 4a pilus biogenesis protein PilO [Trueperaceae bacterium]
MKLGSFNLRNLRQRDIAIIAIVLSLVAGALWYFYMYRPTQDRITDLENSISLLDIEIRRGEDARNNLPDLRLAVAQLEEDRRVFLSQLPTESEVAGLIDQLRVSAADSNVLVQSLSQGSAQEAIQDVRPIGFDIATSGNYGETMEFLTRLESLERFTKIRQVSLSIEDNTTSNPDLNATYNFTVYVYTGTDPGSLSQ